MEIETSDRGFKGVYFTDCYKYDCYLAESSSASEDRIWLGLRSEDPIYSAMHLSQEHVRQLLPFLNKFAETGKID